MQCPTKMNVLLLWGKKKKNSKRGILPFGLAAAKEIPLQPNEGNKVKVSQSDLRLMKPLCSGFGRAVGRSCPASLTEGFCQTRQKRLLVEVI